MKMTRFLPLAFVLAAPLMAQAVRTGISGGGSLAKVDDDYQGPIPISFPVNFYGTTFTDLYISTNGYVTFGSGKADFTPEGLRGNLNRIVAPFFADVDNRGVGTITYGTGTVNGRQAFSATWTGVGYFELGTNKTNTFQVVLLNRSDTGTGNFDVEFNYNSIQWEAGDFDDGINGLCTVSVCGPAVGYSNGQSGTANISFELSGSHVRGAFLDSNQSSGLRYQQAGGSGVAGRLIYPVRSGQVITTPTINSCPAPQITANSLYTFQLQGTGGNLPYTWALFSGSLGGLTLNQTTGVISGTPTVPGSYTSTLRISSPNGESTLSSTRDCTIVVVPATPQSPTITATVPNTYPVCGTATTIRVTGTNFSQGSRVRFNGTDLVTRFVTATALDADITAALLTTGAAVSITVANFASDGTQQGSPSNAVSFTISVGNSTLSSISPNTLGANSAAQPITIQGTGFADRNSIAQFTFNGTTTQLATTFRGCTSLSADLTANLLTTAGQAQITVANRNSGGAQLTSNSQTLTITSTTPPSITSLSPASAQAGSTANVPVTVTGANFRNTAVARWTFNGQSTNLATQFNSATSLVATVTPALLATAGQASITIVDGSLQSQAASFQITSPLPSSVSLTIQPVSTPAAGQTSVSVNLSSPAATALTGTIALNFTPDASVSGWPAGTNNAQVVFANGQKTTTFTIPQGGTAASIANNNFALGTVAGVVTVAVTQLNGTAVNFSSTQLISAAAPVITPGSVKILSAAGGITVDLDAYATTRDLATATFVFQPASGATLSGSNPPAVSLGSGAQTWFSSANGQAGGGNFHLSIPFSYTGDITALGTVSVTLSSSKGSSAAQSGGRQ